MYYLKHYGFCDGDYLAHHGIKGQKWGKRNGPPYPLSDAKHNKVVKRASKGSKKVSSSASGSKKKSIKDKWNNLSDKQKALIIASGVAVGLGLTATALYPYRNEIISGFKNINSFYTDRPFYGDNFEKGVMDGITNSIGNIKNKKIIESRIGNIDPKTGFKLKSTVSSIDDDVKAVNKAYNNFSTAYSRNCGRCTMAYEMRRRGYDVIATAAPKGNGTSISDYQKVFNNKLNINQLKITSLQRNQTKAHDLWSIFDLTSNNIRDKFTNDINSCLKYEAIKAPNSRGGMSVNFGYGSHSMAYEITNGVVNVIDSQTGRKLNLNSEELNSIFNRTEMFSYYRFDDLDFNLMEIKKYVQ